MKLMMTGAAAAFAALALAAPDATAGGYHGGYHGYYAPQHFRPSHGPWGAPHAYGYTRHRVIVAPAYYSRVIVHPHPGAWRDPRWSGHQWAPSRRFQCQAIGCTRRPHRGYAPAPYAHGFSGGVGYGWGW